MRQDDADRCDGCRQTVERVGVIHPLDGGGGRLCRICWEREMRWRSRRNAELVEHPYSIEPWPGEPAPIPV